MQSGLREANKRAEARKANRLMMWVSGLLGLTTGIGVVAWGAWSLIATLGLTVYERSGVSADQVMIEDALNQGMLQSAMLIALGIVILELRRIAQILERESSDD